MNAKVDYISQMVADTFSEAQDNVLEFKAPKEAEAQQVEMNFRPTRASYDAERACLVIEVEGERIELPSTFGALRNVDFNSPDAHFYISVHRDPDHLIQTLSEALNRPIESLEIYAVSNGLELEARFLEAHGQAA